MSFTPHPSPPPHISISPLLARLWPSPETAGVKADEIALAISHIFTNQLSQPHMTALLMLLHFTGWDRRADVIAKCAAAMREAALPVDQAKLREIVRRRGRKEGGYMGGLCDIVGTGGDSHSTFNISTTSSLVASSLLLLAKHGNRASTSKSGSADILSYMTSSEPGTPKMNLQRITATTLPSIYETSNYAFLFAPQFHPGMKHVAEVRKQIPWRTIFNLLGPLANPVDALIEARVVGVARRDLGRDYAEALRMSGARKAMVICGEEDLDELSCAGPSLCWKLVERPNPEYKSHNANAVPNGEDVDDGTSDDEAPPRTIVHIEDFRLTPGDFGLPRHPLSDVSGGKEPHENAAILRKILRDELSADDPILHFVLINTAALFVVSGICDADESCMGEGDDGKIIMETGPGGGRWKEGVRRARWCLRSGAAWKSWENFVAATHAVDDT